MAVGGILDFVPGLFDVLACAFYRVAAGEGHGAKQNGNDREDRELCLCRRGCFHGIGRMGLCMTTVCY